MWNPGDGSDTVEGQDGLDTMLFNGANVSENIDIAANGQRVLFTRNVANITMDLNGVEQIQFNALGGADNIVVHDLSGTSVTEVDIDLGRPSAGRPATALRIAVTVGGNRWQRCDHGVAAGRCGGGERSQCRGHDREGRSAERHAGAQWRCRRRQPSMPAAWEPATSVCS